MLVTSLSILEKYGRHLLKPLESRSNMWRYIKFSNQIFKDKIDAIRGGRDIMVQLGYTESIDDGLSFPNGAEPNQANIAHLVADILLTKREIEVFLAQKHPNPADFEKLFMSPDIGQVSSLSDQDPPLVIQRPSVASSPQSSEQTSQGEITTKSSADENPEKEKCETKTGVCDICGDNSAEVVCIVCDKKQLCTACDEKWHKHPKRQNHARTRVGTSASEKPDQSMISETAVTGMESMTKVQSIYQTAFIHLPPETVNRQMPGQISLPSGQSTQNRVSDSEGSTPSNVGRVRPIIPDNSNSSREAYYTAEGTLAMTHAAEQMIQNQSTQPRAVAQSSRSHTNQYMDMQKLPVGMHHSAASLEPLSVHQPYMLSQSPEGQGTPVSAMSHTSGQRAYVLPVNSAYGQGHYADHNAHNIHRSDQQYSRMYTGNQIPGQIQQSPSDSSSPGTPLVSPDPSNPQMYYSNKHQSFSTPSPNPYSFPSGNSLVSGAHSGINFPPNNPSFQPKDGAKKVSQLLAKVMAIPDLEKRKARIEVHVTVLEEDLQTIEKQINHLIMENSEFYQDSEFIRLSNQKGILLRRKRELEDYEKKLDAIMASCGEEQNVRASHIGLEGFVDPSLIYEYPYSPHSFQPAARKELGGEILKNPTNPLYSVPTNGQGLYSSGYPMKKTVGAPLGAQSLLCGVNDYLPVTLTPTKPAGEKSKMPPPEISQHNPEGFGKMQRQPDLLLEEDKRGLQHVNNLNQSRQSVADVVPNINVIYPPTLPASNKHTGAESPLRRVQSVSPKPLDLQPVPVGPKQSHSSPNIAAQIENKILPVKSLPANDQTPDNWQCQHCTWRNQNKTYICDMCFKTSDRRVSADKQSPKDSIPHLSPQLDEEYIYIQCEKCTYYNPSGRSACEMCNAPLPSELHHVAVTPKTEHLEGGKEGKFGRISGKERHGNYRGGHDGSNAFTELIEREQDQVYLEKKEAQRRYQELQGKAMTQSPAKPEAVNQPQSKLLEVVKRENISPNSSLSSNENYCSAPSSLENPTGGVNVNTVATTGSGPTVHVPNSSYSPSSSSPGFFEISQYQEILPSQGTIEPTSLAIRRNQAPENFAETIEKINLKRCIEQNTVDGRDMVSLMKYAEQAGFGIEVVPIALAMSIEEKLTPMEWLKKKWQNWVDEVVAIVAAEGAASQQNDIGKLSSLEAMEALMECQGNIKMTVQKCVKERKEKFKLLNESGTFARENILEILYQNKGNVSDALDQLNQSLLGPFLDRIWSSYDNGPGNMLALGGGLGDVNNSFANSVITHDSFEQIVRNQDIDVERRIRLILVESKLQSWGRAEVVIKILDNEMNNAEDPLNCTLEDVVEAVRNCGDRRASVAFLTQECGICFSKYPMSKICKLNTCNCNLCRDCLKQNFEVGIRERHVRNWTCPLCSQPDLENETAANYFEFLQLMLRNLVELEVMELFDTKLRDWHLMKSENFRWCAHCANGFIWEAGERRLDMVCQYCNKKTCFLCKRKWEEQHRGLSCEQFSQWKIDNDADNQAAGLARHLEENGIDCPSCKMRYSLAKGGCMHFKCPQCGHEFCSGCYQPFLQKGMCNKLKSCRNKGLHCDHPRDCFYYLRDHEIEELQQLLRDNEVVYNTDNPAGQVDPKGCPVMEQKEYGADKKDEPCGKELQNGMAGLCVGHYKEYLVGMINKNKLDPVSIMSADKLKIFIERNEKHVPKRANNENEAHYRTKLIKFIQEKFPLTRR
ncbi:hypothetical protein CHS0354_009421 [Potamilus streckersoni]|nr:hypothetical protein CHS0354_009421 [Potamilus streckersoni]